MIKFNPENKDELTFGECLGPAMEITDPKEAKQYKVDYVDFIQKALDKQPRNDDKTAEDIVNINLGYYAGYYGEHIRERVERLFNCSHPIFGSIKENGTPTDEQAFRAGLDRGAKLKK